MVISKNIYVKMLPYLGIIFLFPYAALLLLSMTPLGLGAFVLSVFVLNPLVYFIISFVYGLKNKSIYIFTLTMGIMTCFTTNYIGYKIALIYTGIALIGCISGRMNKQKDKI